MNEPSTFSRRMFKIISSLTPDECLVSFCKCKAINGIIRYNSLNPKALASFNEYKNSLSLVFAAPVN